jgi:Fe2+ transport system protein FeoA
VEVVEIVGGEAVQRQLSRQGIRAGATLEVRESAPMGGPVLVETRGSTLALGRGLARKVIVRVVEAE